MARDFCLCKRRYAVSSANRVRRESCDDKIVTGGLCLEHTRNFDSHTFLTEGDFRPEKGVR